MQKIKDFIQNNKTVLIVSTIIVSIFFVYRYATRK